LTFFSLDVYEKYQKLACDELREIIRGLRQQPYPNRITRHSVPREPGEDPLDLREVWAAFWTEGYGRDGQLFTVEYFVDGQAWEIVVTDLNVA